MTRGLLALGAAALLLAPGCFVRPWAIEESERIDRLMECEVDDAEDEAFEGIASPRGLSPVASVERVRDEAPRKAPAGRKKVSSSKRGSSNPQRPPTLAELGASSGLRNR